MLHFGPCQEMNAEAMMIAEEIKKIIWLIQDNTADTHKIRDAFQSKSGLYLHA